MMKALSKLYTANIDNMVVLFSTNLKEFADALIRLEPNADTYFTYRRKFEKSTEIEFTGVSGKVYILQEVYNYKKSVGLSRDASANPTKEK
ncbi:hypothetical protein ABH942_000260 [Flavobacterium sp. 28YEA47A]|uniref:hypothetical protein n=1 Tax=Flavobacterium sp. 28YEA47A TaxID=3156276 RepID=UPI0035168C4E